MRRLSLLAVLALGLAACGGSGSSNALLKIKVGRTGGLVPYAITIAPGGAVTPSGGVPVKPNDITNAQDVQLSHDIRAGFGSLKNMQCPGTFPDEATYYLTALGRTVSVRGTCEPAFSKLWNEVMQTVGLNQQVGF